MFKYEYAVKFVCGKSDPKLLAPGQYWTAINVHNPIEKAERFEFRKKFVIAPPNEKPGKPTDFVRFDLPPDYAMEIDSADILRHLGDVSFAKGFVVIQSATELDVVAVYTAAPQAARAGISAMHMERVPARIIA